MSKTEEKSKTVFFIDKEQFKSATAELTVRTLLVDFAKENPSETTLASKHGNDLHKYTDLNETIHVDNGMKFIVLHNSPTPVT